MLIPEPIAEINPTPVANEVASVIIPTYNMGPTIEKAIKSVLTQNYPHKELIVVDDGSTDDTKQIVSKFSGVKYIYQKNLGCGAALNTGIKRSVGAYLSWLSADDYYISDKAISKRVKILQDFADIDFVYSWYKDVRGDTSYEYRPDICQSQEEAFNKNTGSCLINGSTLLMRRKIIYNIGLFNYAYRYCQDWDYWYRLAKFHRGFVCPEFLVERTNLVNMLGQEVLTTEPGRKLHQDEQVYILKYVDFLQKARPTICAMICVKNEEQMIEMCIDDLIQWVDKIVIFNDGSTDSTLTRIQKYPKVVDIFNSPTKGNIRTEGKDRQKLLEMADAQNTDWLLFIDADEVFEHNIKWEILDLITSPMNLWSFLEVNFWRSYSRYRHDELWYKGWFGRLFRKFPGMKIQSNTNEHCGGIPYNFPDAEWWREGDKHKFSKTRVKHYGFAEWDRNLDRYLRRMERDPFNPATGKGGWAYYERMINETGLELKDYEGDGVSDVDINR